MLSLVRNPLSLPVMVTLIAVVFGVCSSRATASCGDYLYMGHRTAKTPLTHTLPRDGADVPKTFDDDMPQHAERPVTPSSPRCTTPGCGNVPDKPLQTGRVPDRNRPADSLTAFLQHASLRRPRKTSGRMSRDAVFPFAGYPLRIDRPPR